MNLRWDRFRYESGDFVFGDPDSPVHFRDYHGDRELLPVPPSVNVVERAGCDEHPVDAATAAGRETLQAYLWPDQCERFELLEGALELARTVPARVERSAALPVWLTQRLAEPAPGVCTAVFHSIVMQYVDADERDAIAALFAQVGKQARADAPLARLAFEPAGAFAELRLTLWPGGQETLLAECGYHGTPVRWFGNDG